MSIIAIAVFLDGIEIYTLTKLAVQYLMILVRINLLLNPSQHFIVITKMFLAMAILSCWRTILKIIIQKIINIGILLNL